MQPQLLNCGVPASATARLMGSGWLRLAASATNGLDLRSSTSRCYTFLSNPAARLLHIGQIYDLVLAAASTLAIEMLENGFWARSFQITRHLR